MCWLFFFLCRPSRKQPSGQPTKLLSQQPGSLLVCLLQKVTAFKSLHTLECDYRLLYSANKQIDRSSVSVTQREARREKRVSIRAQTRCGSVVVRGLAHPAERGVSQCNRLTHVRQGPRHYTHSVTVFIHAALMMLCVWTGGREHLLLWMWILHPSLKSKEENCR